MSRGSAARSMSMRRFYRIPEADLIMIRNWRERAEEARAVAESLAKPQAREHMLACAAAYDRLAVLAALGR